MLRFVLLTILAFPVAAQDRIGTVQVRVSTDRADWRYDPGQPVRFRIVAVQDGHALSGIKVTYRIGPEMMPPKIDQTATLTDDGLTVEGGTLDEPGFLRCIATVEQNGKTYRGLATAAFRPESIKPTQEEPADFDQFWAAGKAALAKLPIDAKITPLPEYGNALTDCYQVNLQNVGMSAAPSRFYGVLCEPKAPGKYPALLSVPGAGVRPYRGLAEMAARGIITLQVGIHGIPVTLDQSVYDSLGTGALANYNTFGLDSRDRYYYRRVYLGCVRANDFLTSHPKWDGVNLVVTGGSQGGALSIVTAALDPRVRGLAAYYPALSDVTGYLHNRAGGWPHMFRNADGPLSHRSPDKIETSRYYDVVNFARRIKVPGLYSWGFNDETCPPTSMYSAYNVIPGQKKLLLALETGHNNIPEQVAEVEAWLQTFLRTASRREMKLIALLAASLAMAQSSPDGWLTFQDPQGRFQFQHPAGFGAPSPGTDNGFGNRTASIRFAAFSAGVHQGALILGGEAVLTTGPPQLDLQAAGGLYDPIALQVFPDRIGIAIRNLLPVLTVSTFCDAIRREQHLDPADARLSALTAVQRSAVASVDRMGNIAPKVLQCDTSDNTITFHKQSALDAAGPQRHVYGAIRLLPPPYSSFQLIRGGGAAPTAELLRQITAVVNSWKAR